MDIISINHKSLKLLMDAKPDASVKGLDPQATKKIRRQIAALQGAEHPNDLRAMSLWKVHELTPRYPGKWALHVTANYRLTFNLVGNEIHDLDFEDYH